MSEHNKQSKISNRRKFLKLAVLGSAGVASINEVVQSGSQSVEAASSLVSQTSGERAQSALLRMQEDLHRALAKQMNKRSWAMLVDPRKCIGCNACTIACKAENVTPPGVSYRKVKEVEVGEYPDVQRIFKPTNCVQCDNPPCIKAAPTGALYKRPDGIVAVDYSKFTSREMFEVAKQACPYNGLYFDEGQFYTQETPGGIQPFEKREFTEYGNKYSRTGGDTPIGSIRKCHFCAQRLDAGMLPACVTTCIGEAVYFGDKRDSQSLVSEMMATHTTFDIHETANTKARVLYILNDTPQVSRPMSCTECHS